MRRLAWQGVALVGLFSFGCGGGGGGGSSDPVTVACERLLSCNYLDSSELAACKAEYAKLETYVADPEAAAACIGKLSCSAIGDEQYVIDTCVAYDVDKFSCQSSTELEICNTSNVCRTLDCATACSALYDLPGGCGYDSSVGYERCMCTQAAERSTP